MPELYRISSGKMLTYDELIALLKGFDLDELHEFRYDPDNAHLRELLTPHYKERMMGEFMDEEE